MSDENILIEKIKVLDLHDGDIICLLSQTHLSNVAYNNIKQSFEILGLPRNKVIILEEGMDIKLIRTEALKAELAAQGAIPNEIQTNNR